ncbi:hypothetical protein ARMSODRAFT_521820 [Armillaria solidipes]|uniref:F-box domain-containing protein n=1 Tax=Armillaria solidipes TaxID=1076256 RepID=A0A2H3BH96_9AGAR|nr:hypothetical protein ARMSODRAFT_521820 [Armillaria solidipes]
MTRIYGRFIHKKSTKDHITSLPQELVDIIVNNLEGDIPTLKSCSLVCRKLSSRCPALLFKRCRLHSGSECNTLLGFSESTLRCIKTLCIPSFFTSSSLEVLNHPSFHRLVASLGPLELEVHSDLLSWSQLNESARKTLSDHPFRCIYIESSSFQSIGDICSLLRSSHHLERLILPTLKIEETSVPQWAQIGPSVSHLTVTSGEERLRLFQSILATSCPISVNNLRVLDVNISHAEDLGLLREVLAMTEVLQELKVSHEFLKSKAELLPAADLNLASVESLTVKMSDYQELECPIVYPALFRWWCEVWANTRATSIDELVIRATLDRYAVTPEFDTTLWSQIARTLSSPPWETLSTLTIVIYTPHELFADSVFSPYIEGIEDIMAALTETQSVEVAVSLEYPEPDYEFEYDGDDPVEGGEDSDEENLNIGYPF